METTTRVINSGSGNIAYSSWDEWNPNSYLQTYFSKIGADSYTSLKFLTRELLNYRNKPVERILDFGAGPTVFGAIAASPYVREIHIADYLSVNLVEIDNWLKNTSDSFNWDHFVKYILKLEGKTSNSVDVKYRYAQLKKQINKLLKCDASSKLPLGKDTIKYPIVMTNFCADSATSSKKTWGVYMKNICSLVEANGMILISALRNCQFYKNGKEFFPCANINEVDLKNALISNGFASDSIIIEVFTVPECEADGFTSIMCAKAIKNR